MDPIGPVLGLATAMGLLAAAATARRGLVVGRSRGLVRRLGRAGPEDLAGACSAGGGRWRERLGSLARRVPGPPPRVVAMVEAAALGPSVETLWSTWVIGACGSVVMVVAAAGPGAGIVAAGVVTLAPLGLLWSWRNRHDDCLEAALPEALEAVARSLRSGASLSVAVAESARTGPPAARDELARVAAGVSRGLALEPALDQLARRRPLPGVRLAVAALGLASMTGGAQARAVDAVATTLRERLALDAEVRAQAAQARISAAVLGIVPLLFGAFAATTDPRIGQLLFATPLGLGLVAAGLTLDGLGWLWMQRLTGARR